MKAKKLTPRNAAPVQRENTATVSRDAGNAITPSTLGCMNGTERCLGLPFAGDDAE
jgi:prenylated cyclic peptide (anacyclamide/piricyclamide family)